MKDHDPSTPKQIIDPEHLLRAIKNSMNHSHETGHGVTGLSFKNYTITIRKRKDFCWYIECKFKPMPVEMKQGDESKIRGHYANQKRNKNTSYD
jgi:hypothetical protein